MLKVWVDELIRPTLVPIVREGVFVNEGLNHLRKFLLHRSGKLDDIAASADEVCAWKGLEWDRFGDQRGRYGLL